MSGIGERSPFPSRSRRRSGGVHHHPHHQDDASFASPFFGSTFLGSTSRISPRDSYVSPIASGRSTTRRRFLFEEDRSRRLSRGEKSSSSVPSTPKAPPSSSSNSTHINNNNTNSNSVHDGIPLDQLRELAKSSLEKQTNPELAVFYMGMVYTKTSATGISSATNDAFLYAKSLVANQEYRRAVYILEKSGLILGGGPVPPPAAPAGEGHDGDSPRPCAKLRLEATLLAAQALTKASGQIFSQEAQRLLEDASRPLVAAHDNNASGPALALADHHQSTTTVLDDEDDLGWEFLARSMGTNTTTTSSAAEVNVVARLCYWRGRSYDACSYPSRAKLFWKRALQLDPKCQAAWERLWTRHLLTAQEAHELLGSKRLLAKLQAENMEWLGHLYLAQIPPLPPTTTSATDKHEEQENAGASSSFSVNADVMVEEGSEREQNHQQRTNNHNRETNNIDDDDDDHVSPSDASMDKLVLQYKLDSSPELLALAAKRAYRRYDVQAALDYCQELALVDPLCQSAALVHVASLVALGHKRGLFGLAHEWVEGCSADAAGGGNETNGSSSGIAWFAVGAYYYACGKYHRAQHHFCRATRLDPQCSEAWLGFGCSFAACDESDQALAAFRAAQRLAPAEPTSLLYMGMEYVRTNHLVLAKHALGSVLTTDPQNPLGYHELGVAAYQAKQYEQALEWLGGKALKAIFALEQQQHHHHQSLSTEEMVQRIGNEFWEPTIFNLGHAYRKLGQLTSAMACYERCLVLVRSNTSALSAMGFCQHLLGNVDEAIDYYHQALSQSPDDPFCGDMVYRALNEAMMGVDALDFLPTTSRSAAATPRGGNTTSLNLSDDPQHSMMMMDDSTEDMSMT